MTAINDQRTSASSVAVNQTLVPSWQHRYARWLVVTDAIAIAFSLALAQRVRFGGSLEAYREISVAIAVSWLGALWANRSRSQRVIGSGAEEYRRVWLGTMSVFGGIAIISMLFKLEIARGYLMVALPAGVLLLMLFRWAARRVVIRAREKRGQCITRVLAVGSAPAVHDLTAALAREPWSGYEVVGACVSGAKSPHEMVISGVGTIPTFGNELNVVSAILATGSQAVAITATEHLHSRRIRDLSWELEKLNIDLLVAPGVVDIAGPRLHMRPVAGLPLIHVEKPQYHGAQQFQKRLFDIIFSGAVLICALPFLLTMATAIKLTSKGPVFYRQERIGLDGKAFKMIKFRTMVEGADKMVAQLADLNESEGGVLFKIREDPRVTVVGRFLRKYSLDEMPQFINVLKRDMSVVGPRPPLANEVNNYDDNTRKRLLVRPGITGLWQVSGRSDLSWEDSVRLDLFYVENWSMMADLLIALKTIKAILGHSGAY
ncbi:sugar transferase [Mycolicibacterium sp.]|uniref:sugar transferase n=1 Tax=Mycolicibacterium sp. TaxID=2320850 RepID=UPI0028B248AC|nr:sugar transferase [Mycolicibacterium sp.]